VPASGFYEWRKMPGSNSGKTRQPFWFRPRGVQPIAFAGLWETWHDRESGGEIDSGAIVTTSANASVQPVHDRMPVVIAPEDFEEWLTGDPVEASALLRPAPDDLLDAVPVSNRVNRVANDDPGLIEALNRGCFYVGALGSRKTHAKRLERLRELGFEDRQTSRIHAPIGLPIGAVSPAEIALAIMAEITAVLRKGEITATPGIAS
jgi:xanthine/CO dehydrogenase XdhC/CoxF family maturation factor